MASQYYKQLRSFHAVALTGGFTAGADYLGVGQPTVTEQVKELEERFQVELFYRQGRRVTLSGIGAELYEITRTLFACEGEAMALLAQVRDRRAAAIRVGSISSAIGVHFASELRSHLPDVDVELSFIDATGARPQLHNFALDFALSADPELGGPEFHRALYRRSPLVAVVHERHPWAVRRNVSLHDLASEPAVLVREPSGVGRQLAELCRLHGMGAPRFAGMATGDALLHAVLHARGVAAIPAIEHVEATGLTSVPVAQGTVYVEYYLCCLLSRVQRPVLQRVLATLVRSSV